MKFLVSIFAVALLAFALGLYLPWWTTALAGFIVSVMVLQSPGRSFVAGFLGIFMLWAMLCLLLSASNHGILAARIAAILPLGGSVIWLIFATALVGALTGGLGALTGSLIRKN